MAVTLHTTRGDIKIELFAESVPKTAENFLALCASSFYNGSPFHRLIPGFMAQAGSPASDPKSKSSTSIFDTANQLFEDEIRPALRHNARGIVSMANKGPNSNGSQFFITFAPAPHLDGKNTVFGKVIDGLDVLDDLEKIEVDKKISAQGAHRNSNRHHPRKSLGWLNIPCHQDETRNVKSRGLGFSIYVHVKIRFHQ